MQITENILMTLEDRRDLLSRLKDKSIDVAVLDLEYGIGESKKNHESRNTAIKQKNGAKMKIKSANYQKHDWDDVVPPLELFLEINRVSKDQIYFGANYFEILIGNPQKPPRRNEYDAFLEKHPIGWIIWDKLNGDNDFSDCEVIYTSFQFPSHIVYFMWSGMMQGIYCGTDFDKANLQQGNKKLNERRFHPTQKPVQIYKYLLSKLVKPQSVVLDTGFGSASIGIACHDFEVPLIACEKIEKYYKLGVDRLKAHVSNGVLFSASELTTKP